MEIVDHVENELDLVGCVDEENGLLAGIADDNHKESCQFVVFVVAEELLFQFCWDFEAEVAKFVFCDVEFGRR